MTDRQGIRLRHRLSEAELSAVAGGEITVGMALRLRAVTLSKHKLLLEAVRRRARAVLTTDEIAPLEAAFQVLTQVQGKTPTVLADVLTLPHVGAWAIGCLRRLQTGHRPDRGARIDLAQLAAISVAAGLKARCPFELTIPLRQRRIVLPDVGTLTILNGEEEAHLRFDGITLTTLSGSRYAPLFWEHTSISHFWRPIQRIKAHSDGLSLDVAIEQDDHLLALRDGQTDEVALFDHEEWSLRFGGAWRLLARYHRPIAAVLSHTLSTLVPLSPTGPDRAVSTSSGWTYGAIALSLPSDELSLAETLVHELQHLVLSAVEDLIQLVQTDSDKLYYAPWRDDPRPPVNLLQGCFAHLAVTDFWRRQRMVSPAWQRLRADVEFARWRTVTLQAAQELADSGTLTEAGHVFVAGISDRLMAWQDEEIGNEAHRLAADMNAEHLVRWRITQLRPEPDAIERLVRAWLADMPPGLIDVPVTLSPVEAPISSPLADLLKLQLRNYAQFQSELGARTGRGLRQEADMALLRGDLRGAAGGYVESLITENDPRAWVGLALLQRRSRTTAASHPLLEHPEVLAALYSRLRMLGAEAPRPDELIAWLAET